MSTTGKKLYNNGIEQKYFSITDQIPYGFMPGGLKRNLTEAGRARLSEIGKQTGSDNMKKNWANPDFNPNSKKIKKIKPQGKYQCKICNNYVNGLGQHIEHAHNQQPKTYYDTFLRKDNEGICPICGQETTFKNITAGYYTYCSISCAQNDKNVLEKKEATCLDRYGTRSFSSTADFVTKIKATKFERYGDENYVNVDKARQTNLERYGVENTGQVQEFIEKRKQTNLERYGFENAISNEEIKERQRAATMLKFGVPCSFQVKECRDKAYKTKIERYGSYSNNEKVKQTKLERYGDPNYQNIEAIEKTCLERYGVRNPAQLREVQQKATITRKTNSIASDGEHFDSMWEVAVYEFFKKLNIPVERRIPIGYEYNGKIHTTTIDFKVDGYLLECKGDHLLNGCFDCQGVPIAEKLRVYQENHVILITKNSKIFGKPNSLESNGLKYQNKCRNPLIGIDFDLFNDPKFPYDDTKPKCFYNVRVDNHISSLEAWNDLELRWKMIKNRIEYSGGFIDAKQILTAMNVTRTCKQPSWFSKNLAKDIIKKYCTSNVIVDPFAGWGTRCDAAIELGKTYVGSDLNSELVNWHISLGRNIKVEDANTFKYNKECSVFICPPYSDPKTGRCFEDYNFDGFDTSAKALSQCDWLKICMENIPNAKEYVMVCKIVDSGFEQYIVDTKSNKSHFGLNNEYIIVIKQNDIKKEGDKIL